MGGCKYSYARIPRIGQRFQEAFTPVSHTLSKSPYGAPNFELVKINDCQISSYRS